MRFKKKKEKKKKRKNNEISLKKKTKNSYKMSVLVFKQSYMFWFLSRIAQSF